MGEGMRPTPKPHAGWSRSLSHWIHDINHALGGLKIECHLGKLNGGLGEWKSMFKHTLLTCGDRNLHATGINFGLGGFPWG